MAGFALLPKERNQSTHRRKSCARISANERKRSRQRDRNARTQGRVQGVVMLPKALIALVPAGILLVGSVVLFFKKKTISTFLQLLGVACLVVVVLTHVCEAIHLFLTG